VGTTYSADAAHGAAGDCLAARDDPRDPAARGIDHRPSGCIREAPAARTSLAFELDASRGASITARRFGENSSSTSGAVFRVRTHLTCGAAYHPSICFHRRSRSTDHRRHAKTPAEQNVIGAAMRVPPVLQRRCQLLQVSRYALCSRWHRPSINNPGLRRSYVAKSPRISARSPVAMRGPIKRVADQ